MSWRLSPRKEQTIVRWLLFDLRALSLFILTFIIFFILRHGVLGLSWKFFSQNLVEMGKESGIFFTIIGTVALIL